MSYKCELCNYTTMDKSNYNKHLSTKRHLKNTTTTNTTTNLENQLNKGKVDTTTTNTTTNTTNGDDDYYKTVYMGDEIIPENTNSKIDNTLQIIGDSAKNLQKASDEITRNVNISKIKKGVKKDVNELENDVNTIDGKKKNDMVIVAVAIIVSIVIVWVLFKDKILEFLDGNKGFNPANMDNTKIEWV